MVNFKQLLEKASNGDHSEPDWETIMEIVEEVKTKNVSAKNAIKEFRKRLLEANGNVVYHTLLALDSLMKNCASDVHSEVLCVEFLGCMKAIITSSKSGSNNEKAVDKALELIGEWKSAFGEQSGYKAINTIFSELEREGYHIPVTQVASAAFIKKAPDWLLRDHCFLCRQEFNRFKGKLRHHCRNCGQSVCATCSGKRVALPHFGVVEATRVCDICYKKVEKGDGASAAATASEMDSDLPVEYLRSSLAQESQVPSSGTSTGGGASSQQQQIQEEDDLQLAIAMSLNEQENKPKKVTFAPSSKSGQHRTPSTSSMATPSAPPPAPSTLYASIMHDNPPESSGGGVSYAQDPQPPPPPAQQQPSSDPLARYLDRSYWEQRKEQQASGIPLPASSSPGAQRMSGSPATQTQAHGGAAAAALPAANTLADSVQNTIQMFVKRLHELNSTNGNIAVDPVVLSLYQNLTAMQPQLLKQIDEIQQQKAKFHEVVNRLNEAKEARVTLNRMRREHQDKVKQMEQEQAMLARMQMEQKLALLRQQKQEQLAFQQTLQSKRLEVLNTQRMEYQQKVALQREMERQHLIAQEQKVLQHQFGAGAGSGGGGGATGATGGGNTTSYGGSPQPQRKMPASNFIQAPQSYNAPQSLAMDPTSLPPLQSMTLQDPTQALPLPPKMEYNAPSLATDPMAPPPYNPNDGGQDALQQPSGLYDTYQPPSSQGPTSYQPQGAPTSYQPPGSQPPTSYQPPGPTSYQPLGAQGPTSYQPHSSQMNSYQSQPPPGPQGPTSYQQPTGYGPDPSTNIPSMQQQQQQPAPPPSNGGMVHIPPGPISMEGSPHSMQSGNYGRPAPNQQQQPQQQQPYTSPPLTNNYSQPMNRGYLDPVNSSSSLHQDTSNSSMPGGPPYHHQQQGGGYTQQQQGGGYVQQQGGGYPQQQPQQSAFIPNGDSEPLISFD